MKDKGSDKSRQAKIGLKIKKMRNRGKRGLGYVPKEKEEREEEGKVVKEVIRQVIEDNKAKQKEETVLTKEDGFIEEKIESRLSKVKKKKIKFRLTV